MSSEIMVIAIAQGKPGTAEQLITAIKPCVIASQAESGCLMYTCNQDEKQPDRFIFVERWQSHDALNAHFKSEHFKALGQALITLLASPPEISVLKTISCQAT